MKTLVGKIVSTKMDKTIVVEVITQKLHPLYKKIRRVSKRYKVHCDDKSIKEGDMVKIATSRPISSQKHFKFVEVTKN